MRTRHRLLCTLPSLLALVATTAFAGPIRLSTTGTATLGTPALTISAGSVAELHTGDGTASLYFSESNFTNSENIDALHVLPNGHLVLSTAAEATLGSPPVTFQDGDLVDYDPVNDTATVIFTEIPRFGTNNATDIDALWIAPNGHYVLSTENTATLGGLTFLDGDLVDYDPTTDTATLLFSESHFAGDEDIDAVHVLPNGHIVLSVERDTGASLGGLVFKDGDLVEYDPVNDTATLYLSESVFTQDEDVDALDIGCGNGTVETDEECDGAGESAGCNENCTLAECGDGIINDAAGETCDDGGESATCDVDCTASGCGDGTLNQTAGETCDDGGESATCDVDCTIATCGDGTVNTTAGEDCDDSGESATCDADCTDADCGDSTLNATAGEECDDGNTANGDCCFGNCLFEPQGNACPADTDLCTTVDACDGTGTCEHLAQPELGCRAPISPGKSQLRLSNAEVDLKDKLLWKYGSGAATTIPELGNPAIESGADYKLCIYDGNGLLASADAPAGGFCAGKPCWKATKKGFTYVDKELTPDGIHKIILQAGDDGKTKIVVKGKGPDLDDPALPVSGGALPVTVQLKNTDGICWDAAYSTGITKNLPNEFKAKSN